MYGAIPEFLSSGSCWAEPRQAEHYIPIYTTTYDIGIGDLGTRIEEGNRKSTRNKSENTILYNTKYNYITCMYVGRYIRHFNVLN